jgi:aromatic ring-cleaving dioxygenase
MIQDFQLNPKFNIYFDGIEYHAKIYFDDKFETETEEITASALSTLAAKIGNRWRQYLLNTANKYKQ